ncbi:MAG TPA: tail fiber protein [Microlunatus sp.]|nr:tail fiber protein [Microlunatus sp.]
MSEPFLGEIRAFGFNFAPQGWALCQGQTMSISQNSALFSLLGTMYGGDGRVTFGLPDLRGRTAISFGQGPGLSNRTQGELAGEEQVTLNAGQIAPHTHGVTASSQASGKSPSNSVPAYTADSSSYGGATDLTMNPVMIKPNAGGQPHDNMPPYLVINYCIATEGIYPSRP